MKQPARGVLNNMNWVRRIFLYVFLLFLGISVKAQILNPHNTLFYNNGQIFIDSGVVVQIYGNTISTGSTSLLVNNGELYVHFDSIFLTAQRGFTLDNNAIVGGNGYYEIEPDWTNNTPNFFPGESHVNLMSDVEQKITGIEITYFYQLEISGNGIVGTDRVKRMTLDTWVIDSLSLHNREMATDSFVLHFQNTIPNTISHNTTTNEIGFISSLKGDSQEGSLIRRTANSNTPYLFPVGSSVNPPSSKPYIYRPVDILPKSTRITSFGVRFVHESPDIEGFDQFSIDDSICSVNPLFYHIINRPSGTDSARVSIYYDPVQDVLYDYITKWGTGQWNLEKSSQYVSSGVLLSVFIPNLTLFSNDSLPFILSDRIPGKPTVIGDNDVCSKGLAMLIAEGNSGFYQWSVPSTMQILSDPGEDTLIIKVADEGGYINLIATSSTARCVEAADSFLLEVNPGPDANFTASLTSTFTNQDIDFRDSTIGSPIEWFWNFGDGNSASSPITKHKFSETGDFIVEMYVMDENGCLDSTFKLITILEGITIPNVFTPNGDGKNDFFYIPNSGIKEYHLQIFNRWGGLMFETTAPEIAWDGHTNTGEEAKEGTYYYILEANSRDQEYVFNGYLTLFR